MGIVDELLANPGLYVGKDTVAGSDLVAAARIMASPLPGGAGVSLDYAPPCVVVRIAGRPGR
jgi:hypothetical protein